MIDAARVRYDTGSDTLYIALVPQPAVDALETESGFVVRIDAHGNAIGATVMDARERWSADVASLAGELARRLPIDASEARQLLDSTLHAAS